MYKIDLHSHSIQSRDGGLTKKDYKKILKNKTLDYVALTDHDEIDLAIELHKELGDKVIVGEEISTGKGDLVGLFLKEKIDRHLGIRKTIVEIKKQNGLVYMVHPFDFTRHGLEIDDSSDLVKQIDIVEIFNARSISGNSIEKAKAFAKRHNIPGAASSDSHGILEIGKSFTLINNAPTKENLANELKTAMYLTQQVSPWDFLNPLKNRLKKIFT